MCCTVIVCLQFPQYTTGFCSHSAALQHLQSCVLCVVPVCVHTVLPYSTYRAVCCVLYRFVFTQCCLAALTGLCVVCCTGFSSQSCRTGFTELRTATASRYRYKLCVISPQISKYVSPHYKIIRVLCDVECTHAQIDDAPFQLNRSFAHDTLLK